MVDVTTQELRKLSEKASKGPYVFNGYPFTLAGADAEFAIAACNYVRERLAAAPNMESGLLDALDKAIALGHALATSTVSGLGHEGERYTDCPQTLCRRVAVLRAAAPSTPDGGLRLCPKTQTTESAGLQRCGLFEGHPMPPWHQFYRLAEFAAAHPQDPVAERGEE